MAIGIIHAEQASAMTAARLDPNRLTVNEIAPIERPRGIPFDNPRQHANNIRP